MAFRFPLETVLRLRRSLEDGERLRLQTLLSRRAQLQSEVGEVIEARATLDAKLKAAMQQGRLSGGEMQFAGQRLCACQIHTARLNAAAATLKEQIERQQSVLLQRRVERKVLEQVREQRLARYEAEAQRRGQAQVEEMFLLRRARGAASDEQRASSF